MLRPGVLKVAWALLVVYALVDVNHSFFKWRWTNAHLVREVGLLGYMAYDVFDAVVSSFDNVDDVDAGPYRAFVAGRASRRAECAKPGARPKRNVVFLQLESVDFTAVDAQYKGEPVMPFTAGLRDRTLFFETALDQTGPGRSSDAHVLVLTSQIPIQNRVIFTQDDTSKAVSLPRILGEQGYFSFSLEGHQGEFWRWKLNHRRLGFDESSSQAELDTSDILGWGVSDMSLVDQAMGKMELRDTPFFAHILLLTHHHPFHFVRESHGETFDGIIPDYLISAKYVDSVIEHLFEGLKSRGLLENTIVAVYSDHDSGVSEDLNEFIGLPFSSGVEHERIPFLIYDGGRAERVRRPVGLQDLPATVLDLLGLPIPDSFMGVPEGCGYSDVLFQNGKRVIGLGDDGELETIATDVDMSTLTRLGIYRPEALLP